MRVTRIDIVTAFEQDDQIVLSAGAAIKHICAENQGHVVSINVPALSPSELPRALIRLPDDVVINIGLNRFQLSATPPSHVANDASASLRYATNRALAILEDLLQATNPYTWSGVIAHVQFPDSSSPSATEAITPLFDRLFTIGRQGRDLASFHLQYGVRDDGLVRTYTVSGYETRRVLASTTVGLISELPIDESGVNLALDINNRERTEHADVAEEIEQLAAALMDDANRIPRQLGLGGKND